MKIGPGAVNNVIPISSGLRSKKSEGEGGSARQQYDPNQTRKDGSHDGGQQRHEGEGFDPQLIDAAVESFKTDAAAQEHGLSAVVEGNGPGLKIHVKDCNGTTLRQFSGEEFIKLRQATSARTTPTGKRGKILDQKL